MRERSVDPMKSPCLCQICSCGRHGCPHTPSPAVILNRDRFVPSSSVPSRASTMSDQEFVPMEGQISNTTTFRSDYVPHSVIPKTPTPARTYSPPIGVMLLKSTYMQDYWQYSVTKTTVNKTEQYRPPTGKMALQSTYNEEYQAWNIPKCQPFKMTDNLRMCSAKFDAKTTVQEDFCPRATAAAIRQKFRPTAQPAESLPFDGNTIYRLAFVSHPIQHKQAEVKVPYKPNSAPLDAMSVHCHDRGIWEYKAQSCKPKQAWEKSLIAFEGMSESQEQFRAWPARPATSRKPSVHYSQPEGQMELVSMAQRDYQVRRGEAARSARPPRTAWSGRKAFKACSTMKEDFRAWEQVRRGQSAKPRSARNPPGAFEGTTNSRSQYTPKTIQKAKSFKPATRVRSTCEMELDTVCQSNYTKNKILPCPASFPEPPGFDCLCKGGTGHMLKGWGMTCRQQPIKSQSLHASALLHENI